MSTTYYVGVDIAAETFVACVLQAPNQVVAQPQSFTNDIAGYDELEGWLRQHGVTPASAVLCMEATGVYSEGLAYHLSAHEWWLAVAPPLQAKRAFTPVGHKTDPIDSRQIAEYAARFHDQLHRFVPKKAVLEQVKVLLQLREQYVRQKTTHLNAMQTLRRKVTRTPLAEALHKQSVSQLKQHIKTIEAEIAKLLDQDPDLRQQVRLLITIPGVGLLLASHIVVLAATMRDPLNPKAIAAHLGISPYQHRSGTSVRRRDSSRHYGPSTLRKLLHLAARSRCTHHPASRRYYQRKVAAGKPKRLVLNNMANRLLRVICAVLRTRQPFLADYQAIPPQRFKPT
jgi:transposase